jgi:hypothetical protein
MAAAKTRAAPRTVRARIDSFPINYRVQIIVDLMPVQAAENRFRYAPGGQRSKPGELDWFAFLYS